MILGPLAILLAWVGFGFIFLITDRTGHTTISGLSVTKKTNYTIFSTAMILSGFLIFLFIKFWFADALNLPTGFVYISGLAALVLQPLVGLFPFKSETSVDIHNVAVYMEGALLPVMAIVISLSSVLPLVAKLICGLLTLWMFYMLVEFKRQFLKSKFMYIQIAYIASFHLIILMALLAKSLS